MPNNGPVAQAYGMQGIILILDILRFFRNEKQWLNSFCYSCVFFMRAGHSTTIKSLKRINAVLLYGWQNIVIVIFPVKYISGWVIFNNDINQCRWEIGLTIVSAASIEVSHCYSNTHFCCGLPHKLCKVSSTMVIQMMMPWSKCLLLSSDKNIK